MMDITPIIPEGRKVITAYGAGNFTISGEIYTGSLVILPHKVLPWPSTSLDETAIEQLLALIEDDPLEILLLGCGATHQPLPARMQQRFRHQGIAADSMTTGAACRTYNILLAEGRNVGAAVIGLLNS